MALQPGASTSLWRTLGSSSEVSQTSLKRVVGQQQLTFEEFTMILCQVECCLNSRPLLPLNSHPDDGIDVLTPGHFLVGRPLQALPEADLSNQSPPLLRRWMLCQAMTQHCWTRWSSEYLQQLQRLAKWRTPHRNPHVRDIVLIKEDTLVTTHWPLAWIISTSPGHDGHSRVVVVKTSTGTYKRPHHLGSLTTATRTRRKGRSVLWWAVCWGSSRLIF